MTDIKKAIKGMEEVDAYFHRMTEVCYRGDEATFCDLKEKVADAIALLKEQPEIVRCKDCKHATMTSDGKMCKYCAMDTDDFGDLRDVYHDADWFCADGERKRAFLNLRQTDKPVRRFLA